MARRKTIGARMKSVKSYQKQKEILLDWSKNWKDDQSTVIHRLSRGVAKNDIGEIKYMLDQLRGMTEKRFTGLDNIIGMVCDPDRVLIDARGLDDELEENEEDFDSCSDMDDEVDFDIRDYPDLEGIDADNIIEDYKAGMTLKDIVKWNKLSDEREAIKILVTAGIYKSLRYEKIKQMRSQGVKDDDICIEVGIRRKAMDMYTPYKRVPYKE